MNFKLAAGLKTDLKYKKKKNDDEYDFVNDDVYGPLRD